MPHPHVNLTMLWNCNGSRENCGPEHPGRYRGNGIDRTTGSKLRGVTDGTANLLASPPTAR